MRIGFAFFIGLYLIFLGSKSVSQEKRELTIEDLFVKRTFYGHSVRGINWMKDGSFYTSLKYDRENGTQYIIRYSITTGEAVDTLIDARHLVPEGSDNHLSFESYEFNADESLILLLTKKERIYRRSFIAEYYLYNLNTGDLKPVDETGRQSFASCSPDGQKVAFTRDNNLYIVLLKDMSVTQVTLDGKFNQIINGKADWVYEEEFSFAKAFFWSPDSRKIAYYSFDETNVPEFSMQEWKGLYPQSYRFKYPKAGEENSIVKIFVFDVENGKTTEMDLGGKKDIYIPRVQWTKSPDILSLIRMNRLQNHLEIIHYNSNTGQGDVVLSEKAGTYVDIDYCDDLTYMGNGKEFIYTSERDGNKHIYHYSLDGSLIRQITSGQWEVTDFNGIDEKKNILYYTSTEDSPLERHIYRIGLKGTGKKKLSTREGLNRINVSSDYKYYINYNSSVNTPDYISLHKASTAREIRVLEDNAILKEKVRVYNISLPEFFSFKTSDDVDLNVYMIKPPDFDINKKYPVLVHVYGGPGSQTVLNRWQIGWHNLLAQKGYIIVSVDNRGTGGRGREFKHITYANLGKWEVNDQVEAAKYLGTLPYIDSERIGIWGWSYGGYMSSLTLLLGAEYFKAAIAVAPVTSWRYYDTIYTERYLKTPQLNASGYDDFSPIQHADKLKGKLLLIHGTGDDNVHFQNSIELQNALIDAGKQFQSFYYPDRNHGIYGGNTTRHLYTMMTDFILKNL